MATDRRPSSSHCRPRRRGAAILRWLAFFAIGDAAFSLIVAGAFALPAVLQYIGAVWDAGFDFGLAQVFYDLRTDRHPSLLSVFFVSLILPGVVVGFMFAARSRWYDGWRFWRWRS